MRRAVITGLGFISSIGNSYSEVLSSLKETRTGVELFDEFDVPNVPVKLAGTINGFRFPTKDYEDWTYPEQYRFRRDQLRAMTPSVLYGYCAMDQAIQDAGITEEILTHPRTGLTAASAGCMWLTYENLKIVHDRGVKYIPPMSVVTAISGGLNINLSSLFKIKGGSVGFTSACASSAHALGAAKDAISLGRQDVVFVVGGEDCNLDCFIGFAAARILSTQTDPSKSPCAFDKDRDGFVPTGGAATLVVEDMEHALKRGAKIYAEVVGWGQSSDGYNVVAPEPEGHGLARAMDLALQEAQLTPADVDYINAHATSTPSGDAAEIAAVRILFNQGKIPYISSTKSLTGHALHMAGALESAISCMAIHENFMPVSANIREIDPAFEGIPIITAPLPDAPDIVMSNSSGFGGSNVVLLFKRFSE